LILDKCESEDHLQSKFHQVLASHNILDGLDLLDVHRYIFLGKHIFVVGNGLGPFNPQNFISRTKPNPLSD
jgi:hypothetical protein